MGSGRVVWGFSGCFKGIVVCSGAWSFKHIFDFAIFTPFALFFPSNCPFSKSWKISCTKRTLQTVCSDDRKIDTVFNRLVQVNATWGNNWYILDIRVGLDNLVTWIVSLLCSLLWLPNIDDSLGLGMLDPQGVCFRKV